MTAVDRLADGYEPAFDVDYEAGRQGELFVARIIDALKTGARVEVKTDDAAQKYGNVYLEYACRYRGEWKPTGIAATEAEIWVQVVGELALAAPAERWRDVARHYYLNVPSSRRELVRGSHPTKGVVIPLGEIVRLLAYGPPDVEQAQMPVPQIRPAVPPDEYLEG